MNNEPEYDYKRDFIDGFTYAALVIGLVIAFGVIAYNFLKNYA